MKALNEMNDTEIKTLIEAGYERWTISRALQRMNLQTQASMLTLHSESHKSQFHSSIRSSALNTGICSSFVRGTTNPWFKRDDYEKKKKLSSSWRKPRGLFNKMRRGFPDKGPVVQVGYGAPSAIRASIRQDSKKCSSTPQLIWKRRSLSKPSE